MNPKTRRGQDGPSGAADPINQQIAIVHRSNSARVDDLEQRAKSLTRKVDELVDEAGDVLDAGPTSSEEACETQVVPTEERCVPSPDQPLSWNDTLRDAMGQLSSRGIDAPKTIVELLSEDENKKINAYLNRPLYKPLPWDKWDLLCAFGVGLVGAAIDLLLGTPGRFVQGAMEKGWLRDSMERIHGMHPGNSPIDFQGEIEGQSFAGKWGSHRGLSPGHDLLRPLEGIRQFKDGVFRGSFWRDGVKHIVDSGKNQHGKEYLPMGWADAVVAWLCHVACDFFSKSSLPIPGTSWLREWSNDETRSFLQNTVYQQGINLRHVTLQTIAPLAVEIGIRSYMAIRYRRSDAPKDALRQKTLELLSLGHTLTVAINVGKIVIMKNPMMLNVPALLALMRSVLGVVILEQRRNSFVYKASRNAAELCKEQDRIEQVLNARIPNPLLLS